MFFVVVFSPVIKGFFFFLPVSRRGRRIRFFTYDWLGEIGLLPVTGSKIDFSVIRRFYLWLVMKGESDFTCSWT